MSNLNIYRNASRYGPRRAKWSLTPSTSTGISWCMPRSSRLRRSTLAPRLQILDPPLPVAAKQPRHEPSRLWMNEWKCEDFKCVWKPTESRLCLTHYVNKSSRWAKLPCMESHAGTSLQDCSAWHSWPQAAFIETWSGIPQTVIDEVIDEWATTTSLRQSKGTSLWALAATNRLLSEPPNATTL